MNFKGYKCRPKKNLKITGIALPHPFKEAQVQTSFSFIRMNLIILSYEKLKSPIFKNISAARSIIGEERNDSDKGKRIRRECYTVGCDNIK